MKMSLIERKAFYLLPVAKNAMIQPVGLQRGVRLPV
jgi:hypothetical protein